MKSLKLTSTWIVLLLLTLFSAMIANAKSITFAALLILVLAAIKFLIVALYFMEMSKAHVFWKITIIGFLLLFVGIISQFI